MTSHDADSIKAIILDRNIEEILHFTSSKGFLGCVAKGFVLPRSRLREDQLLKHILKLNAPFRSEEESDFDQTENWIDYVNLSISAISTNLFKASLRWHTGADISWLIMAFDPALLVDDGVYFSTTNNIYQFTLRAKGPVGLQALFASTIRRKGNWTAYRGTRDANFPTCEQAEVLYPEGLHMRYLRTVYVGDGQDSDWVYSILSQYGRNDVNVVIDPTKFLGKPN